MRRGSLADADHAERRRRDFVRCESPSTLEDEQIRGPVRGLFAEQGPGAARGGGPEEGGGRVKPLTLVVQATAGPPSIRPRRSPARGGGAGRSCRT